MAVETFSPKKVDPPIVNPRVDSFGIFGPPAYSGSDGQPSDVVRPASFLMVDWSSSGCGITSSLAHDHEKISLHMKGDGSSLSDTTADDVVMDCGASDEAFG
ncbi:hypothetical protein V6N13_104971 [Hibiscus sabdariffa]|uniref:Uncharacterized protein n=2 Tax=Hibiscus sabdariffa TaxID=183260 RepID=A0ABR2SIR9_9ROSI